MGFIVAYVVIGALTGLIGYCGMMDAGHTKARATVHAVQLFFFWPIMYVYVIVMVVVFRMLCGGWL